MLLMMMGMMTTTMATTMIMRLGGIGGQQCCDSFSFHLYFTLPYLVLLGLTYWGERKSSGYVYVCM